MTKAPPLLADLRHGARAVLIRPHVVAALLLVNLLAAWVLVAPLRGVLSAELDHNLMGDEMATGASWRWFDTVDRKHPLALGDLEAWHGLLRDGGARWDALKKLSGPPLSVALAGLFLFWVSAVFHCGFLGTLAAERRGFGAGCAHFALPVSALAFFAGLSYAGAYALLYVQTGKWLEDWRSSLGSEWLAIGLTWTRLGVTLAAVFLFKILFDLSKVALVERGGWNWPLAFFVGFRELLRSGLRYFGLSVVFGLGLALLALLWSVLPGRWAPQSWLALLAVFLLQQVFLGTRIALRLGRLAAFQAHFTASRARPETPPYKVEPA
ncbi:MAG TPA: hypothetical protein VF017_01905 [Thermoanaerobaculia bacterium]|nr:hypothetical protein [Thermoanaerobaculia bacterium]